MPKLFDMVRHGLARLRDSPHMARHDTHDDSRHGSNRVRLQECPHSTLTLTAADAVTLADATRPTEGRARSDSSDIVENHVTLRLGSDRMRADTTEEDNSVDLEWWTNGQTDIGIDLDYIERTVDIQSTKDSRQGQESEEKEETDWEVEASLLTSRMEELGRRIEQQDAEWKLTDRDVDEGNRSTGQGQKEGRTDGDRRQTPDDSTRHGANLADLNHLPDDSSEPPAGDLYEPCNNPPKEQEESECESGTDSVAEYERRTDKAEAGCRRWIDRQSGRMERNGFDGGRTDRFGQRWRKDSGRIRRLRRILDERRDKEDSETTSEEENRGREGRRVVTGQDRRLQTGMDQRTKRDVVREEGAESDRPEQRRRVSRTIEAWRKKSQQRAGRKIRVVMAREWNMDKGLRTGWWIWRTDARRWKEDGIRIVTAIDRRKVETERNERKERDGELDEWEEGQWIVKTVVSFRRWRIETGVQRKDRNSERKAEEWRRRRAKDVWSEWKDDCERRSVQERRQRKTEMGIWFSGWRRETDSVRKIRVGHGTWKEQERRRVRSRGWKRWRDYSACVRQLRPCPHPTDNPNPCDKRGKRCVRRSVKYHRTMNGRNSTTIMSQIAANIREIRIKDLEAKSKIRQWFLAAEDKQLALGDTGEADYRVKMAMPAACNNVPTVQQALREYRHANWVPEVGEFYAGGRTFGPFNGDNWELKEDANDIVDYGATVSHVIGALLEKFPCQYLRQT